jgi:hypothetical protein
MIKNINKTESIEDDKVLSTIVLARQEFVCQKVMMLSQFFLPKMLRVTFCKKPRLIKTYNQN